MSIGLTGYNRPGTRSIVGVWEAPAPGMLQGVLNITAAYVPGVSGPVGLWRWISPEARTITDISFFVNSFLFGPVPITFNVEVRSGTKSLPNMTAGGLLQEVAVATDGTTVAWYKASGFNVTATPGSALWICIGAKTQPGGVIPAIQVSVSYVVNTHYEFFRDLNGATSNDGGQTLLPSDAMSTIVVTFSDGAVMGWPYPRQGSEAADAHERGNRIKIPTSVRAFGVIFSAPADDTVTHVNVWQGNAGPGGAPTATADVPGTDGLRGTGMMLFRDPYTFVKDTAYRITMVFSGAPVQLAGPKQIFTTGDATLRSARLFGGEWYKTDASGGAWVDDPDELRFMALLVDELVTIPTPPPIPPVTPQPPCPTATSFFELRGR